MKDIKTILLIGRSGRGKSTLANVVTNTSDFKESSSSVSETKKIQLGNFKENNVDYQIIDTPGIGDTKMSDNEVLDIIAEAIYRARDGVSQVFFVIDGRFDQYEMATYDLLRTMLFDENITKHTTVVRTRFADFRKPNKCEEDISSMAKELQEKVAEAEKEKRELNTTSLAEIISSCNKVVHVDNPSLEVKSAKEAEIKMRKNKRNKSRGILLKHLNENCQQEPYKPENLKKLSEDIADDYFRYLEVKAELQKELDSLKEIESVDAQSSETKGSDSKSKSILSESNKTEPVAEKAEESQKTDEGNIGIVDPKEQIAQLQDKRDKLRKEIAEKEKVIRQKVLKHIFNNYEGISKELGGDIFLNSVAGDHNWQEIHPKFTKELVVKWLSQGFSYQQTKDWAAALIDFDPQIDADFCIWLRNVKELTVERIKRLNHPYQVKQLRSEYVSYLKGETDVLDKHNRELSQKEENQELSQAQKWLNYHYPFEGVCREENNNHNKNCGLKRYQVTSLSLKSKNLAGSLELTGFSSLRKLNINVNQITNLKLTGLGELEELHCSYNQLTNLNFLRDLNEEKLKILAIGNNNISGDLVPLQRLANLGGLWLENNKFSGSLIPLREMSKLYWLNISNISISSGLEYLPEGIENFSCSGTIAQELKEHGEPHRGNFSSLLSQWKKVHSEKVKLAKQQNSQVLQLTNLPSKK
jgi:GTP-binding protein EngB required for normal cell division